MPKKTECQMEVHGPWCADRFHAPVVAAPKVQYLRQCNQGGCRKMVQFTDAEPYCSHCSAVAGQVHGKFSGYKPFWRNVYDAEGHGTLRLVGHNVIR